MCPHNTPFTPEVKANSGQGNPGTLLIFLVFPEYVPQIKSKLSSASFIPLDS